MQQYIRSILIEIITNATETEYDIPSLRELKPLQVREALLLIGASTHPSPDHLMHL